MGIKNYIFNADVLVFMIMHTNISGHFFLTHQSREARKTLNKTGRMTTAPYRPINIDNLILFMLLFIFPVCNSQCPNPATFDFVPEENYDKDFRSVTPGGRPLGFEFNILYYEADGQPNPCFEIPDTADRRVEIMAEPDGAASSQLW